MEVGEIAASAAGDQDFLSQAIGMLQDCDVAAALAGFDGAHQSRRAATENKCIEGVGHCDRTNMDQRSHVKQAEARQAVLFQKALVDVLLLQLVDLRRRHLAAIG